MSILKVTMTANELQVLEALRKVQAEHDKTGAAATRAGTASKKASQDAMGGIQGQIASLASMAAGYLSVGAAVALVTRAFTEANAAQDRFASKGRENAAAMKSLATLTPGDLGGFQKNIGMFHALQATGNFTEPGEIASLIKTATAGGFVGDVGMLGRLQGTVSDAAAIGVAANQFQRATGAAGGMEGIISGGLAAGRFAPGVETADLLAAAAHAGPSARGLGATPNEILAVVTSLSRTVGAGEAGSGVRTLAAALSKRGGYEGLGLIGGVRKLAGAGLSEVALRQELPKGAYDPFVILRGQLAEVGEIQGKIAAGGGTVGATLGMLRADPEIAAAEDFARAEQGGGAAGRLAGVRRNLRGAILTRGMNQWRAAGVPGQVIAGAEEVMASGIVKTFPLPSPAGSDEMVIAMAGTPEDRAKAELSSWIPQLIAAIRDGFREATGRKTLSRVDEDR
ncbi:MAG: hypothetical protein IMZ66_05045 [Planctomycetes bacterium]|nr:hypothetical protein [Planctomycetota bacterium]